MEFFNDHPKLRLVFAVAHVYFAIRQLVCDYLDNQLSWATILVSFVFLYASYFCLVKGGIIQDKNVSAIDAQMLDMLNIVMLFELMLGRC